MVGSGRLADPTLTKLFLEGDQELSHYYQWRTSSFFNGDSSRCWSLLPRQMFVGGSIWIPPPNPKDEFRLYPGKAIQHTI
jgi:hypothetical protein